MKKIDIHIILGFIVALLSQPAFAQLDNIRNQPFADQKLYHLGFSIGLNSQDLVLKQSGFVNPNGEIWFAQIPAYSPGFTVGIIGDRYINQYLNLRVLPTFQLGEKDFVFREQTTGEEYKTVIRSNYLSLPILLKFNAERSNNIRPYLLGGAYVSAEVGGKKGLAIRLNQFDYGLQFGIGCNFYLSMFKLCPELKFSFGFRDLIDKNRGDLSDTSLMKYTDALSSGRSRTISLIFNFE